MIAAHETGAVPAWTARTLRALVALERMGVAPGKTLFVGDSVERDIRPATRLGLGTVLVGARGETAEAAADHPRPDRIH